MAFKPVILPRGDENQFEEITNQYGFRQVVFVEDQVPCCAQCHAYIMPNRGQGMICDTCDHESMVEFRHDYDVI
jgi:hypothetical protein